MLGVFDVGRELGEDVNARGVGLPVSRSQFGVPGREGTVLYETVRKGLFRDQLVCVTGAPFSCLAEATIFWDFAVILPTGRVGAQHSLIIKEIW